MACPTRFAFSHTLVRYALLILKRYQHHAHNKLAINSHIDSASICSFSRSTKQNPSSSTHRQLRRHTVHRHRHRPLHDIDFDLIDFDIPSLSLDQSIASRFVRSSNPRNSSNRSLRIFFIHKHRRHRHSSWLRSAATSSLQPKSGTQM